MTWAEALRVLGITQGDSFKDARRAYLKLIKVHKPEQDPEGFQRVRQAFEIVGPALQACEGSGGHAENLFSVAPRPATVVVPEQDDASVPAPATDTFEPDVESEPDGPSAVSVEREHHLARWMHLVHSGDIKGAVPDILQSLDHAVRFPLEAQLPGNLLLHVIGELAARGECIAARHVNDGVRTWLLTLPSVRQAFSNEGVLRWVLLDELVAAEQQISTATYQALAKAIMLSGEEATKDLELRQVLNPGQSRQDLFALLKSAPTLAKTFSTLLDPAAPETGTSSSSSNGWWRWSWVFVLIGISAIRHCGSLFSDDPHADGYVPPKALPQSTPVRVEPRSPSPGKVDSANVEKVGLLLASALAAAGDTHRTDDAVGGLLHGQCDKTGEDLADLHRHAHSLGSDARDGLKVLWAEFEVKCPNMMKRYEP